MKLSRPFCLVLLLTRAACSLFAAGVEEEGIEIQGIGPGQVEFNYETGFYMTTNDFVARYQGAVLTAHRAQGNRITGDVEAEGAVNLQYENQVWSGDRLQYNFFTHQIRTARFRTGRARFLPPAMASVRTRPTIPTPRPTPSSRRTTWRSPASACTPGA